MIQFNDQCLVSIIAYEIKKINLNKIIPLPVDVNCISKFVMYFKNCCLLFMSGIHKYM